MLGFNHGSRSSEGFLENTLHPGAHPHLPKVVGPNAGKTIVGAGNIACFFRMALSLRRHQQQCSTETRCRTTQEYRQMHGVCIHRVVMGVTLVRSFLGKTAHDGEGKWHLQRLIECEIFHTIVVCSSAFVMAVPLDTPLRESCPEVNNREQYANTRIFVGTILTRQFYIWPSSPNVLTIFACLGRSWTSRQSVGFALLARGEHSSGSPKCSRWWRFREFVGSMSWTETNTKVRDVNVVESPVLLRSRYYGMANLLLHDFN